VNKQLLLEKYIKVAVRKALKEEEAKQQRATKAMYLVYRFPGLKKVMIELMSPSFGRFIQDVTLTAPKPTTFNIKLADLLELSYALDEKALGGGEAPPPPDAGAEAFTAAAAPEITPPAEEPAPEAPAEETPPAEA